MAGNLFDHGIRDPESGYPRLSPANLETVPFFLWGFEYLFLDTEPDQGPGLNNWFQHWSRDPDPGFGTRIQTKELGS